MQIAKYEKLKNGSYFWTVNEPRDGFYGKVIANYHSWSISDGKEEIKKDFPNCIFK